MFERIKEYFQFLLASRTRVVSAIMVLFAGILVCRLFVLQILRGQEYQDNYLLLVEKEETIPAVRGNIYDRNGELLAYNDLAYAVTIEDNGSYRNSKEKNESINEDLSQIIRHLEKNGDQIDNNFGIFMNGNQKYEFVNSGSALQRFRADIFGYASTSDLKTENRYGINEVNASAQEIMDYLYGEHRYQISEKYPEELRYKIAVVRYNMGLNSYQKYIATTIASSISPESVAYLKENENDLTGVEVVEKSVRKYVDSECFAHVIGYTGQISVDEYNELSKDNDSYSLNDVIGKAGIEQYMDVELAGTKGKEIVYVDNVGNPISSNKKTEAVAGNDVYLSIDKDLQVATYKLLEQEIAGILYSKIINAKEYIASDNSTAKNVVVPIYDVYYALINNSLIDIYHFDDSDASATEQKVNQAYLKKKDNVFQELDALLSDDTPTVYNQLPKEYQAYSTFIVTMLKSQGVFDGAAIDTSDEEYKLWTSESLSVNDYLKHAIDEDWIDITKFSSSSKYSDTEELYLELKDYVLEELKNDTSFIKLIYKYLLLEDSISGNQLCVILYDQGILPEDENLHNALMSGSISSYQFMLDKIRTLEITPGQLGLDPCSGSSVITDSKTGEILACVSYPGYDTNKLANSVDASYYAYLTSSSSNPLYNHATQQRTAPGSTFKIVSSTAGLAENVVNTSETIVDNGPFEKVDNKPKCWIYPSGHGAVDVAGAIRDSCNIYFYEVGYRLAGGSHYSDSAGIKKIQKYASLYGLDDLTGIEIEETKSEMASEFPVMAAIGQSDNNYTTIALARYANAVSNKGQVYDFTLLSKVVDQDGNIIKTFSPSKRNYMGDVLTQNEWNAIHHGMRMVVQAQECFNNFPIAVAGKTGTAQQVKTRPNHALFIGFAPYDNPEIAIASRIPHGYASKNAADVTKNIMDYYFGVSENIITGEANSVYTSNEVAD